MTPPSQRPTLAPYALAALAALAAGAACLLFVSGLPAWLCTVLLFAILAIATRAAQRRESLDHETEQRFRAVVDHALVGIGRVSPDGRWIDVNPTLARMLGFTAEAMQGKTWGEMTHPDDLAASRQAFESVLRGEHDSYSLEKRYIRPDGASVDAVILARAVRGEKGQLEYLTAVITDVTERRRAERALAQQAQRATVLLDLPIQAEALGEREFMQYALEQAESLTGSQIGFMHFINDDESIELIAWSRNTLEKYCHANYDSHYPLTNAGIWADAVRLREPSIINDYATAPSRKGLPDGHSQLLRLLSVPTVIGASVRMVTGVGNKQVEYNGFDVETVQLIGNETWRIVNRLRSEKAYRLAMQVVNASPVVCFRWQATNTWPVVFVSDNVRQWGYTPTQLIAGHPHFAEMVHPDDLSRVIGEVQQNTAAGLTAFDQEYRLLTADNRPIWISDRTQIIRDSDGQPIFYDGVITDINERKQQELLLSDNLARQQTLNKRLEEASSQLMQSEKMASIGQLAAGIAHELNNPIGFVHSNLGTLDGYLHDLQAIIEAYQACLASQPESAASVAIERLLEERDFAFLKEDIFKLVSESKEGLGRVRKIVQDLKSFSRVGEQEWQEADLHQGLDSTLNIVRNELKYKCKVVKEYGDIPPVYCLISQLNQVFMNLLVNAGHAIEKQGTITIRTRLHGEDSVCIEIADSGSGMPPEILNRIFDPFFTTKPVGKGTGLGLSLSYNIVHSHHGRLEVSSEPGVGSAFRVILPIHQAPGRDPATPTTEPNA